MAIHPQGLETISPRLIRAVGIVGAGTMGCGIALAVLAAGFPVILVEQQSAAREAAARRIAGAIDGDEVKRRLSADDAADRRGRLQLVGNLEALASADLVIEAVYEDLSVKRDVLQAIAALVSDQCILASNTSTLDLNRLAEVVKQPGRVVGLHFFSPAHIMRLVEVIRADTTSPDVLASALQFVKKLDKVGVVAEVCDGFIGNRMFEEYLRQAYLLLEEGALPEQIDNALEAWGMAMGPIRTMDLAGQDIGYNIRRRRAIEQPERPYSRIPDLIVEMGRHGQKTGAGFYVYPAGRKAVPDPAIEALIAAESQQLGLTRRAIGNEEIVERCVFALINEGAKILEDGIAARPLDVDMVWLHGYGFPRPRGGPMVYADTIGLGQVLRRIQIFAGGRQGWAWQPAALLERLAKDGIALSSLNSAALP